MSVCYDTTKLCSKILLTFGLFWLIVWFGSSDKTSDKWLMMFFIILLLFTIFKMDREDSRRILIREFRRELNNSNNSNEEMSNRPDINIIRQYISSVNEAEIINSEKCVICLDDYEYDNNVGKLRCEHKYHQKCIERWLMEKTICPLCKYNVLSSNDDESLDDNPEPVDNEIPLQIVVR